jgi:hypothetical protein
MTLRRRILVVFVLVLASFGFAEAAWAPLQIPPLSGLKLLSGDQTDSGDK